MQPETSASSDAVKPGIRIDAQELSAAFSELASGGALNGHLNIDPDRVQDDLAKLVLTLMEFLRRLMEMQAIRRMEAGSLSDTEEEALGTTLMLAQERIYQLAEQFGLEESDLNLDLGPFGRLL